MAEQTQTVKNRKLLLVALGLGVLVALIYNLHVSQLKNAGKSDQVVVLRFKNDMDTNRTIALKDLEKKYAPADLKDGLGSVVVLSQGEPFRYEGYKLTRAVQMNQLLTYDDIQPQRNRAGAEKGFQEKGPRKVPCVLSVDPALLPPGLLPGDIVNIVCDYDFAGQPQYYRIISGVRVDGVGELTRQDMADRSRRPSARSVESYRKITVLVSERVSLKLCNVTRGKNVRVERIDPPSAELEERADKTDIDIEAGFEELAQKQGLLKP